MNTSSKLSILYFTDVLCVWAYLAQIRIDQLKSKFGSNIDLQDHFISVFGSVESKMEQNWGSKGGITSYSKHVREVAANFAHVNIHPEVWVKNTPTSSGSCHLFLKAVQILDIRGELGTGFELENSAKTVFETVAWELRLAFFRDLVDVSSYQAQMEIAERLGLPIAKLQKLLESGEAFAALDVDAQLKEKHAVSGSPSLVFNEGRQIIYGNVGFRVIEANIQELLKKSDNQASWC